MPPKQDKLPEAKLATLKQWITQAALEKAGSTAKIKAKPKIEMKATAGAGKPEGPPPMPEGLSRQPSSTRRVRRRDGAGRQPLGAAGGRGRAEADRAVQHRHGATAGRAAVSRRSAAGAAIQPVGHGAAWPAAAAAASRDAWSLYDVQTGQRITEIGDELDAVLAADINDDHTQIALGGPRRVVRIYSVADGVMLTRSASTPIGSRDRIQPRRRAADHRAIRN